MRTPEELAESALGDGWRRGHDWRDDLQELANLIRERDAEVRADEKRRLEFRRVATERPQAKPQIQINYDPPAPQVVPVRLPCPRCGG